MATGRIRRTARRGVAVAVLGWLSVAAASVVLAPSAAAAPSATIEIRNVTPPVASVDPGGTVTFVNKIPAENRGGLSIPLPLGRSVSVGATVYTDVTVDFFGQRRALQPEQSTSWRFDAPATAGTITYTYRVVPQAQLPLGVSVQQVVDGVLGTLPKLPAPIPYVVQTIAPALPNLPSVGLPQLPQVALPPLPLPLPPAPAPGGALPTAPEAAPAPPAPAPAPQFQGGPGTQYAYTLGAAPQLDPRSGNAAAAFDPSRFLGTGGSPVGSSTQSSSGTGSGSGGQAGTYDGASVPVFGQLAGLNGTGLDEESAGSEATADTAPTATPLPAAALAAVVALAAASAALVRTHQASRASR
ncbi:hypothetical protein SAMN05660662_4069 [Blastococcus aurantiacus]|uniref:Uncharacterized protein n=1 Tax=Blastococcus aurantiacus TaxID=1550231 RepID=A0A1G7QNE7_9ACTN|nr:hypothetical protein [Blastococcus aurantiacus]SDF99160.1 hypothetical protein SAMN05660662_4069 [Blastococcus aurantiacus]